MAKAGTSRSLKKEKVRKNPAMKWRIHSSGLNVICYWTALIVMSVSIIGVIQSMLRKSKFQCACLGAVFKLPLSKITLLEDALMILMNGISLWMYYN